MVGALQHQGSSHLVHMVLPVLSVDISPHLISPLKIFLRPPETFLQEIKLGKVGSEQFIKASSRMDLLLL